MRIGDLSVKMCWFSLMLLILFFFFSSRRRHTRLQGDWSSDVCSSDRNVHWCRWYRLLGDYCFSVSSPNQMVKKWVIDKLWWTHLPGSFVRCEPCQVKQMSNLINWEVLDLVYKHEVGTRKGSAKGKLLSFIASDSFCSATILTVFSIWLCTVTRNGTFITVFCFQ